MDDLPGVLLSEILSYLPRKSYLPFCHVSHRFRTNWLAMKRKCGSPGAGSSSARVSSLLNVIQIDAKIKSGRAHCPNDDDYDGKVITCYDEDAYETDPLQIGNIFISPWNKPGGHGGGDGSSTSTLRTSLLQYYVSCGWTGPQRFRKVMHGAAARGDIEGMSFMAREGLCAVDDDEELCTVAGAAGQLGALIWLREGCKCPWNPTEVYREASENSHEGVMTYVEMNSLGYQIHTHYGVGLPAA